MSKANITSFAYTLCGYSNFLKMPKNNTIQAQGEVIELLPNTQFKVKIFEPDKYKDKIILSHLAGRMRMHYIRIVPGDRVKIELSPYDLEKGRIVYRI